MFFFIFFISRVISQNFFDSIIYKDDISVKDYIYLHDSLLTNNEEQLDNDVSKYSNWFYKKGEVLRAIETERRLLEILLNNTKIDTFKITESLTKLGKYERSNNLKNSISYLNEALDYTINDIDKARIYVDLGISNYLSNKYLEAIECYELALNKLKKEKNIRKLLRKAYGNAAYTYLIINTKKSYQKGEEYAIKTDSISQFISDNSITRFKLNLLIATFNNKHKNLNIPRADIYYKRALNIAKINLKDSSKISDVYNWLGNLYNITNYEKSFNFLEESLSYCPKNDSLRLYRIYYNKALTNIFLEEYERSLLFFQRGLEYLLGTDLFDSDINNRKAIFQTNRKRNLRYILPDIAQTYYQLYITTEEEDYLNKCISYYKLTDYVIDLLRLNSTEFESKLFWKEISTGIYGKAIRACYLQNNVEDAFYFMEKNKAMLLMEDISEIEYRNTIELPKYLLNKELKKKKEIFWIKTALKNTSFGSKERDSLHKSLLDKKRLLQNFQDSLYGNKIHSTVINILSINEIQEKLKSDEVVIEYHTSVDDGFGIYTNKEKVYVLFISKDNTFFYEINDQSKLKKQVKSLRQYIQKPLTKQEDWDSYNLLSNEVYKKLFPTKDVRELIKGKRLQIITDNYLSLIPFESLIFDSNTNEFLIETSEVSYQYSMSFLNFNNSKSRNPQNRFIGFAPISFSNDSLATLHYSKKELKKSNRIMNGKVFLGESATKENFLGQMNNASIIHLATHAESDDIISPWIAFKNEKLYLDELYLTKNQADLVVLSACKTASGEIMTGEGVLSLARGFFHSGAESVMSSLWNTDDKSTSDIMQNFYRQLKKDKSKSKALREAKLKYIHSHSVSESSPYYWANLVLLGDAETVELTHNNIPYIIGIVILFLLLILFLSENIINLKFHG